MKTKKIFVGALLALMFSVSGTASAGIIGSSANVMIIPDGFSYTVSPLIVSSAGTIGKLTINIAIDHTWLGDLKITLGRQSTNTSVVLMDRPGVPASAVGASANLSSSFALSFSDAAGLPAAESIGSGCNTFQTVGDGASCLGTAYLSHELLSAFTGESQAGAWYLRVEDFEAVDRGQVVRWSIDNTSIVAEPGTVPEPASLALLAVALVGMEAARRRRRPQA